SRRAQSPRLVRHRGGHGEAAHVAGLLGHSPGGGGRHGGGTPGARRPAGSAARRPAHRPQPGAVASAIGSKRGRGSFCGTPHDTSSSSATGKRRKTSASGRHGTPSVSITFNESPVNTSR